MTAFNNANFEKKMSDEKDTKIRVGTAIIKNLSTSFYPNPRMIFDELITNSRDAFASEVKLHIGEEEITLEDDGEGMSPEELVKFFYISHSSKNAEPIKKRGKITREIIGKFGIGKLSLYQLCKSFEIVSWKDGIESKSYFDFSDFELKQFVDDFTLHIASTSATKHSNGTKIILKNLKQKVSALNVKRHLMKSMPLTKDFRILISGTGLSQPVILKPEDLEDNNIFQKFEINEFVENVGQVTGSILYKKSTSSQDFGVFVRVFGRLVNVEDPHGIINFSSLTSAQQFDRRIYADLNANGLNDALQTNRAGFVVEHPAYMAFTAWLKKTLNKCNKDVSEKWRESRSEVEESVVRDSIAKISAFSDEKETEEKDAKLQIVDSGSDKKSDTVKVISPKKVSRANDFIIDVEPVGSDEKEAIRKGNKIIVNSLHPLYLASRTHGGLWGVQYHAVRAAITLIALESASTLDEFRIKYNKLCVQSEKIISDMKKRLIK